MPHPSLRPHALAAAIAFASLSWQAVAQNEQVSHTFDLPAAPLGST